MDENKHDGVKGNTALVINDNIKEEVRQIREDLLKQRESAASLQELVKGQLDRHYHQDLWELSERELDSEMGARLSYMNDDIDIRPEGDCISGGGGLLRKPVVKFKRIIIRIVSNYLDQMSAKMVRFNEQSVAFHLASFIRLRKNNQKLQGMHEKLNTLEDERELLKDKLDSLMRQMDKK